MTQTTIGRPTTALDGPRPPADAAVAIEEAPLRGMITLKGDFQQPAFQAALHEVLGLDAPETRSVTFGVDGRALAWMAPDELMAFCDYADAAETERRFTTAFADAAFLAVDVSDARQIFRILGDGARDVLAKGAPIDLHPDAFGVGDVRRTRVGVVAAAILQVGAQPDAFELLCFRSYAPHMWTWLCKSAAAGAAPGVLSSGASSSGA